MAHLNARERAALLRAEGAEALGWALTRWPGLKVALLSLAAGIEPRSTPELSATMLLERALRDMSSSGPIDVPEVLGQLPLVHSAVVDFAARRSQALSRLPWSKTKRVQRITAHSDGEAGAEEGEGSRTLGLVDESEEEILLRQRSARVGTPYPEWHVIRGEYRDQYVTVFETRQPLPIRCAPEVVEPRLAAWFEQPLDRRWQQRLEDGSDVDVDALIEVRLDEMTGSHHAERVYRERLPAAREVACAVLIDRSGSLSQSNNLRNEVACANALTAAMERAGECYAVFSFWSDTRHHVAFEVLRDFNDGRPLCIDPAQLKPHGYTRLGAAIRHACTRLQRQPANRRVLLMLGDAMPSDEGYEGDYALADVLKAVEEAERSNVRVAFAALGRPAYDMLAEKLPGRFTRVAGVDDLAPVLADLHSRLAS
ncbi:MAG: hypothetical protein ABW110_02865 [Steroidobacteraceae bacterium]